MQSKYWLIKLDHGKVFALTLEQVLIIAKASLFFCGTLAPLVHLVSKDFLTKAYSLYAGLFFGAFCHPLLNSFTDPVTEGAAIEIVARRFLWMLVVACFQRLVLRQVSIGVLLLTLPGLVCYFYQMVPQRCVQLCLRRTCAKVEVDFNRGSRRMRLLSDTICFAVSI